MEYHYFGRDVKESHAVEEILDLASFQSHCFMDLADSHYSFHILRSDVLNAAKTMLFSSNLSSEPRRPAW